MLDIAIKIKILLVYWTSNASDLESIFFDLYKRGWNTKLPIYIRKNKEKLNEYANENIPTERSSIKNWIKYLLIYKLTALLKEWKIIGKPKKKKVRVNLVLVFNIVLILNSDFSSIEIWSVLIKIASNNPIT